MAKTCGKCVYAKICKKAVGSWFSPKNIAYCEAYKDSANYVEVVRCKDCVYNANGCCTRSEPYDDTKYRPDYFCADGERREGE